MCRRQRRRWPARRLQVGGTVGALVLCWWLQRARFLAIAILFVIAVPVVGSIGYAGLSSTTALIRATFFAGALVLGIQSGINVVGALIYPTCCAPTAPAGSSASAGSAPSSARSWARCSSGFRSNSSTSGRRCHSPPARW